MVASLARPRGNRQGSDLGDGAVSIDSLCKCGNCRFFGGRSNYECRKNAPTARGGKRTSDPLWPVVSFFDSCGEHELPDIEEPDVSVEAPELEATQ